MNSSHKLTNKTQVGLAYFCRSKSPKPPESMAACTVPG